jgi:hypothetical protein
MMQATSAWPSEDITYTVISRSSVLSGESDALLLIQLYLSALYETDRSRSVQQDVIIALLKYKN